MRRTIRRHTVLAAFVVPRALVALVTVALLATPCSALVQEIPVTACGQAIPRKATGYLTADLDCTGTAGDTFAAVFLSNKASLDLRGFTLTADQDGVVCLEPCRGHPEMYCTTKRCHVFGGGAIVGGAGNGIGEARRIDVENVSVSGFATAAVFNVNKIFLRDVQVTGNARVSWAVGSALFEGSSIIGNDLGVSATYVRLVSSTALGNGQFDLAADRKPVVREGSQCGSSIGAPGPGGHWGVCTNDF